MASSNAEVKNRLVDAIDRCLALQKDHLLGLKSGCLNKVNEWLEERQAMINRLQQAFAEVQSKGVDADLRTLLLEKLGCILETENIIFDIAGQQRTTLAEKLNSMRRGKRTLGSYGATLSSRPPRFVSDNR